MSFLCERESREEEEEGRMAMLNVGSWVCCRL